MLWPSFTPRIGGAVTVLKAGAALSVFGLLFIAGAACAELVSSDPLTATEVAAVKAELADRSFRQFDPHVDGDPKEGSDPGFLRTTVHMGSVCRGRSRPERMGDRCRRLPRGACRLRANGDPLSGGSTDAAAASHRVQCLYQRGGCVRFGEERL